MGQELPWIVGSLIQETTGKNVFYNHENHKIALAKMRENAAESSKAIYRIQSKLEEQANASKGPSRMSMRAKFSYAKALTIRDLYQAQHEALVTNMAFFLAKDLGGLHNANGLHKFFTVKLAQACLISMDELVYLNDNQYGVEDRVVWGTDDESRELSKKLVDQSMNSLKMTGFLPLLKVKYDYRQRAIRAVFQVPDIREVNKTDKIDYHDYSTDLMMYKPHFIVNGRGGAIINLTFYLNSIQHTQVNKDVLNRVLFMLANLQWKMFEENENWWHDANENN